MILRDKKVLNHAMFAQRHSDVRPPLPDVPCGPCPSMAKIRGNSTDKSTGKGAGEHQLPPAPPQSETTLTYQLRAANATTTFPSACSAEKHACCSQCSSARVSRSHKYHPRDTSRAQETRLKTRNKLGKLC